jgi:3-isopropylmalate/(R)-2-methylmalate dehydratase large subunit
MGMTAFEKVMARASGRDMVRAGEVVYPYADLMFMHDGQVEATKKDLDEIGIDRLWDPSKVVFVTDHEVIYTTPRAALRGLRIREAAKAWKVEQFYDVGQGGHGHIFPIENGLVGPGMFIFANDMHCTNFGAVGAIALRAGSEIMSVVATGTLWIKVPSTIRITLKGKLRPGVYGRDVGYKMARMLSEQAFGVDPTFRVIELAGDLDQFDLATRIALCNSPTEIGVAHVFIPPNEAIVAESSRAGGRKFKPVYSDADATYEAEGVIDLSELEPQVALPGGPERSVDLATVLGKPINHAFIGSCGSGMYEDLVIAADILRGKRIAGSTRLVIVPGTVETARRIGANGMQSVFQDAGAIILPPGCGPCAGGNLGSLSAGEVSISTAATNGPGRMGAREAEIFLGSPATVAASAVAGCIADARAIM